MPTEPVAGSTRARLDRLIHRILLGQVVPFLGAGFSQGARWEVDIDGTTRPPLDADAIAQKLADDLMDRYYASGYITGRVPMRPHPLLHKAARRTSDADEDHLVDVHGMLGKLSPNGTAALLRGEKRFKGVLRALLEDPSQLMWLRDALCNAGKPMREIPPLGEIAELHSFAFSPKATVDLLQLDRWKGYQPTPAHHYLAILIREGCITEVFETNYDPFVEQAVRETYGDALAARIETADAALVIHDLATFRHHVAEPRQGRRRRALVKVVKLNGCASAYVEEKCEAAAIVLTEAQLQTWGVKHWARDLLHVAVRSKSLCFLGFGASDPIVRYHALEVMREFHTGNDRDQSSSDWVKTAAGALRGRRWFELNNAPFVGQYGSGLTFYQHQILRSFYLAHHPEACEGFTSFDQVEENTFSGRDGPWFSRVRGDSARSEQTLPADILLSVVVPEVVCRLASERYLSQSSAAHAYLQGALRFPSTLLSLVRRAYLQSDDPDTLPSLAQWMQLPNPPRASEDQPEPKIDPRQTSSLWARLCFALGGSAPGRAGYRSFEDHPIELTMFLALLYIVRSAHGQEPVPSKSDLAEMLNVEGVVRLVAGDRTRGWPDVYVCRNVDAALRPESGIRDQSVILALTRGNLHPYVHPSRSASGSGSGVRTWSTRRVYVISDLDALRGSRSQAVDLGEAQHSILRAIHQPERFIQYKRGWREYCGEGAIR